MTEQNGAAVSKKDKLKLPSQVDPAIAEQLVGQARNNGVDLVGPDGLLGQLTKQVLEAGLGSRWMSISARKNTPMKGVMEQTVATEPDPKQ